MDRKITDDKRRRRPRRRNRKRIWAILTVTLLGSIVLAGVAGGVALYRLAGDLPDARTLTRYKPSQTTEIFSSDGLLLARLFDENREVVPLSRISKDMRNATIAIEDHRFFTHRGVDWRGAARAMSANLRSGGYTQGGSTITQQLARGVYLSPDKNLTRKTREVLLAIRMERAFGKTEILGMYLNQVYYGQRCFGVEAASRRYFGKSAGDLKLAEAALLAGIPQRPAAFDPYEHLDAAQKRRNVVLRRMAETGFITSKRATAAINQPVRLAYHQPPRLTARRAHYFVDYVIAQLEERYGAETVFRGGLKVQTTLNTRAQAAAERAVEQGMNARFGRRSPTQAALVSLDPTNGYVRAMVGGRDYRRSMFNRAVQAKRQPGSAFKPFVYAAAIGAGYKPTDRITDSPIRFDDLDWRPRNYDGRWHGAVTLTQALAQSINIPAIKLMQDVGIDNVIRLARAAGIESPLHEGPSLALGSSEVSPLELAGAYTMFAAGGMHTPPISIVRVRSADGRLMESRHPDPTMVLDDTVARRMDFLLRQVVLTGTGRPAGGVPNARGKTGTTNELKDAWFVGYTPSLVTAVWVGNDKPTRIPGLTGGGACAPIWVSYMRQALAILPKRPPALKPPAPPQPPVHVAHNIHVQENAAGSLASEGGRDILAERAYTSSTGTLDPSSTSDVRRRVCVLSGLLAGPNCPETATEYFPRGAEPTERCAWHDGSDRYGVGGDDAAPGRTADDSGEVIMLCRETRGLAGPNCRDVVTVLLRDGSPRPKPCSRHTGRRSNPTGAPPPSRPRTPR